MFLSKRTRGGKQRRGGLGTVSTQVGNSLVYSSSPVAPQSNLRRPIIGVRVIAPAPVQSIPPRPVGVVGIVQPINQLWGANPPRSIWSGTSPTSTSLATAQALLQTNPSLLTQAQWTMLQQAGLVASTVPYSSASQLPSTSTAIDPATGVAYATELAAAQAGAAAPATTGSTDIGTMLDTPYAGLPLYLWLAIGGVGLYMFSGKRGR